MFLEKAIPPRFDIPAVKELVSSVYRLEDTSVQDLGGYIDQNFLLACGNRQFVLKIHDGTEHRAVLEFQARTMAHLSNRVSKVRFPEVVTTPDGEPIAAIEGARGPHFVRLLTYLPGVLLKEVKRLSPSLLRELGHTIGSMDRALQDFDDPASRMPEIQWDFQHVPRTRLLANCIADPARRRLAEYFFMRFDDEAAPLLPALRKSVVHNDTHRYSILLSGTANEPGEVSGVIDFGDAVYSWTVGNLAIALSDLIVPANDPVEAAAHVIESYHKIHPLSEEEVGLLYVLIGTRLSMYGCTSAYMRKTQPANDHAIVKEEQVWDLLARWLAVNPVRAFDAFRQACRLPSLKEGRTRNGAIALASRKHHFSRSVYTHYREPLHLSGGALQYLYDDSGHTYLDCVNNVCQLGHCHPRVARAQQRQAARLNTNSRYVYDGMAEFVDQLVGTFPKPLSICILVNSGTEANDLALRLARTVTKQKDVLVIDKAYHGNSTSCTEMSPHRVDRPGKPGLAPHVQKLMTPDCYRGPYKRDDPDPGIRYAADADRVLDQLEKEGRGAAVLFAESLMAVGGNIILPPGYLKSLYARVRARGGVCVADEVQVGFGRMGTHMWCFETQGVVPDIVTIGKPIGNGHPMAAVITTREIAEAYDRGAVAYFNTFGGNPVSCAIGKAVLDALKDERLMGNVRERSAQILAGLRDMQDRFPFVGDVRGLGLFLGIELISDPKSLAPATALAERVVEEMKARGFLLNTCGYEDNVIKIKPPLIISKRDTRRLLSALEDVFSSIKRDHEAGVFAESASTTG